MATLVDLWPEAVASHRKGVRYPHKVAVIVAAITLFNSLAAVGVSFLVMG